MPRKKKTTTTAKQTPIKASPKPKSTPSTTAKTPSTSTAPTKTNSTQPAAVSSPTTTSVVVVTPPPKGNIASLFANYSISDGEETFIAEEKLESLFKDMSVDPDGRLALIFAWVCGCRELGVIHQDEFSAGMKKLGFDTAGGSLTKAAQELRKQETALLRDTTLSKNADWKDFYNWGFNICREGPDKRGIDKTMAVCMLKLTLGEKKPHVSQFCSYIDQDASVKVIGLDFWTCFCEFSNTVAEDLNNYSEEEAWPCLIDQYVAFRKGLTDENSDMLVK